MNPANMLPAKLPAGVTQPVSLKVLRIDEFSPLWFRCNPALLYGLHSYSCIYKKQKFLFNTPFPECFCFDDQKNSLFLQFPPISNHPVVVLQADSSNCLNESQ